MLRATARPMGKPAIRAAPARTRPAVRGLMSFRIRNEAGDDRLQRLGIGIARQSLGPYFAGGIPPAAHPERLSPVSGDLRIMADVVRALERRQRPCSITPVK